MTATPFVNLRVAVTGGTSELGLALVHLLHERGSRVAFGTPSRPGRRGRAGAPWHSRHRRRRLHAGRDIATERVGAGTRLRVVDALLTGVHERGTSHYELLRAFADELTLSAADEEIASLGYRPHEFGDSVLVIPHW